MPLFTVCLTTCLFKEKHSPQVWLSLMPIFIGVAIATLTELGFQWDGMISALLATACFSLQNIYSKIVLRVRGFGQSHSPSHLVYHFLRPGTPENI